MERRAFSEEELQVKCMHKCAAATMIRNMGLAVPNEEPLFNRPVTEKENFRLFFEGSRPYWKPNGGFIACDVNCFRPRIIPDNVATHLVFDNEEDIVYDTDTMSSWFGLEWVYVPVAGGATVKPGNPKIEDMNDWEEILEWPDLDALDWEASAAVNKELLQTSQLNELQMLDGFWERLMSLMDVDGAAIALIDEDQKDAVKSFFDRYADFLIDYIRHCKKYYDIDAVLIHDDWGHQNGPFFSLETAREMLVPYLKRVVDAIHELGMYYEQHSCGLCEKLVPAYIEAGVDLWAPQPINNLEMLGETYKDASIAFAAQLIGLPFDASEEDQIKAAAEWFEKYKDLRVIPAFMDGTPITAATIYRLSREYYL